MLALLKITKYTTGLFGIHNVEAGYTKDVLGSEFIFHTQFLGLGKVDRGWFPADLSMY